MVQNQTVKSATALRGEEPSKMDQTCTADGNFPTIAFKPSEFSGGRAGGAASVGRSKTTDVIYDPVGIRESMVIGAFLFGLLVRMRNGVTAAATKNQFFFLLLCLVSNRLLRTAARFSTGRLVPRQAKPI